MFNLSGLSRAATGTNVSLDDGGAEVTDCRRKRKQGKPVYCQHMLHYGISGHFQALANVLKRRIKSAAIFVYRRLTLSLCLIKKKKLDFRCFTIDDVKDTV